MVKIVICVGSDGAVHCYTDGGEIEVRIVDWVDEEFAQENPDAREIKLGDRDTAQGYLHDHKGIADPEWVNLIHSLEPDA